ncbi:MAG: hemerythrin domain-containing protein [Aquabacterium sp.]
MLVNGIANLQQTLPGLNVIIFDTPAFMRAQLPLLESQGFNTTDACYDEPRNQVCANPSQYVFWDQVHPTAATDWLLGSAFVAAATAVPEPATVWLMLLGGMALARMVFQRRRKMDAVCARPSSPWHLVSHPASMTLSSCCWLASDKIRRFADLTLRLNAHLAAHGPDQQAQDAAQSILRYFDIAAPLHHEDEEADLFPALRQLDPVHAGSAIDQLAAEHAELHALWHSVRGWLQCTAQGQACATPDTVDAFAQRHLAHAQAEEDKVYPAAAMLDAATLRRLSDAMVRRRTST